MNSCFLYCSLTSFIFLSASCLSLQIDVARYACVTKRGNQLDKKNKICLASNDQFGLKGSSFQTKCKILPDTILQQNE